jgi:hypothetical protein
MSLYTRFKIPYQRADWSIDARFENDLSFLSPIPLFKSWLETTCSVVSGNPTRYRLTEYTEPDHLGDSCIKGVAIIFRHESDAMLFKLTWM